jgi:hypothetical protein
MMAERRIQDTFNRRFFDIPKYQRGFAWERTQVRELYEDITESIETKSEHYLGTLVLSQNPNEEDHYYIVDGQQRIITITLFVNEIIKHLSRHDKAFYRRFYIAEGDNQYRLRTLGKDRQYLYDLLKGKVNLPQNKSQRLLREAYEEIKNIVNGLSDKKTFLNYIERLEVMEFIEQSEGDAIRIFQTVNDRGKPLSNMEKAKSLLIYFSNRYLGKKLDDRINDIFGDIFENYDDIKHIGEKEGVDLISGKNFNEDSIMRQHFVTFSDEYYDATAEYVLDYLKKNLMNLRNEDDRRKKMEDFISSYAESLLQYFISLKNILVRVSKNSKYYRFFVTLGPSTYLYPLIVKLVTLGKLSQKLPGREFVRYTFLDLVELIDVRIYKTKGTDPRADISRFAYQLDNKWADEDIRDWLLDYNRSWMPKGTFEAFLQDWIYGNQALVHIFTRYCEKLQNRLFTLNELKALEKMSPTIEHILSHEPKFSFKSVGFKNSDDFEAYENTLGNLSLVEKSINSAAQNKMPLEKVTNYDTSKYKMTQILATSVNAKKNFSKQDIIKRTGELANYILETWWC